MKSRGTTRRVLFTPDDRIHVLGHEVLCQFGGVIIQYVLFGVPIRRMLCCSLGHIRFYREQRILRCQRPKETL